MTRRTVSIGGASGGWGDSPGALAQLVPEQPDYLMLDYLAEVTMSLLARARQKDPSLGYVPDFVNFLAPHLPALGRIKVVTNAGGINPKACREALEQACRNQGVSLRIAVVEGDDVLPLLMQDASLLEQAGLAGRKLISASAYLGAWPIAEALRAGADVVITGRCADSALALGPLIAEFGWQAGDFDKLAAGSLLGHVIECGPHATGGIFTDWESVPDWETIGYPIATCRDDGTFEVSKPAGTGGLIDTRVIAEQILYEVGNPARYILPDVVADFSNVSVKQVGSDRVQVSGARGLPPTDSYKVSATYLDGYRLVALVGIVGPNAVAKAERTAQALIGRGERMLRADGLPPFSATHVEVLGSEASYGTQARARATREVVLRLVLAHPDRRGLDLIAPEISSMGLGGSPGTTAFIGGRAKAVPTIRLNSLLLGKSLVPPPRITIGDDPVWEVALPSTAQPGSDDTKAADREPSARPLSADVVLVPLARIAHARSGDKGNDSNIAVIAREPKFFDILRDGLTATRVAEHFSGELEGHVERFAVPGLHAFNFLLHDALGGGGIASMRFDPQGKAFGQRLLEMAIPVDAGKFASLNILHVVP